MKDTHRSERKKREQESEWDESINWDDWKKTRDENNLYEREIEKNMQKDYLIKMKENDQNLV